MPGKIFIMRKVEFLVKLFNLMNSRDLKDYTKVRYFNQKLLILDIIIQLSLIFHRTLEIIDCKIN